MCFQFHRGKSFLESYLSINHGLVAIRALFHEPGVISLSYAVRIVSILSKMLSEIFLFIEKMCFAILDIVSSYTNCKVWMDLYDPLEADVCRRTTSCFGFSIPVALMLMSS
ncbi:hypothetical protein SLEP1_g14929 [Rubroshorea leprosula]|uniref:Uncharacterized protein n=1 Tax=Rubroshorea leprosula TaxID=152421 RepID=A0AAV5IKR0_9ROSI|nr:hypothetical protein SLEP1_g14929 [Rubroshorea leprosula]